MLCPQNQVVSNQLKRQDDDMKSLTEKVDAAERHDREHQSKVKEHERRYADLEAKVRLIINLLIAAMMIDINYYFFSNDR